VALTFTPTVDTLTLTVSGAVTDAQLELGNTATTYQRVTNDTDYEDIGLPRYLQFDGVDDRIASLSVMPLNTMLTFFLALQRQSPIPFQVPLEFGAGFAGAALGYSVSTTRLTDGTLYWFSSTTVSQQNAIFGGPMPDTAVFRAERKGEAYFRVFKDNATVTSQGAGGTPPILQRTSLLSVGAQNNNASPFRGRVYQVMLVQDEITNWVLLHEQYAATKTGLPLP
jgi:hypothetical protein